MGRLGWGISASLLIGVGRGGPVFVAGGSDDGGTSPDGATADASPRLDAAPARDAAIPPPLPDGDVRDAPGIVGEGGSGGDAGPVPFVCAKIADPTVVFCSDFDEAAKEPWNWPSDPTTPGALLVDDTTDTLSAPNALEARTPILLPASSTSLASLGEMFATVAGHIDYAFAMYVADYDSAGAPQVPVAQLAVGVPGIIDFVLMYVKDHLVFVQTFSGEDGGTVSESVAVPGTVAASQWAHIDLLLDRSALQWKVTVSVNGVTALTTEPSITPSDQDLEVDLGILDVTPPSAANAFVFDNVLVRAY